MQGRAEKEIPLALCQLVSCLGRATLPSLLDRVGGQIIVTLRVMFDFEACLPADLQHGAVLGQDVADDPSDLFLFADLNQALEHFGPEAQAVPGVADNQRELGLLVAAKIPKLTAGM